MSAPISGGISSMCGLTMEHQGRRRAAALRYRYEQEGSTLVAKGEDELAGQIMAVAREHGVPIHQDPALAAVLSRLELGRRNSVAAVRRRRRGARVHLSIGGGTGIAVRLRKHATAEAAETAERNP